MYSTYLYKAGSMVTTFTLNFIISWRKASENAMQALLDIEYAENAGIVNRPEKGNTITASYLQ